MPDHTSTTQDATRSLNRSHGSFELAFAPVILALLGLWLDKTIGTVPVFTLVLALVGVLGAFTKVYYSYKHSMAALDQQGAWVGHASTAQFRAESKARADRLARPLEAQPKAERIVPTPSDEALSNWSAQGSGA
ncbi:MAG: AtpZ/AtpI family protein [Actinomycetota bacterium]|nr:AtpZ/AtpI family protein [Actinomycetota bacterium]